LLSFSFPVLGASLAAAAFTFLSGWLLLESLGLELSELAAALTVLLGPAVLIKAVRSPIHLPDLDSSGLKSPLRTACNRFCNMLSGPLNASRL
jgi:hypothetical protein